MDKAVVLIVDDEKIILRAYAKELERIGYKVFTAINGQTAIEIAQKEKIDIVFTDLIMPEMSGIEVCKKIKEISPETEVVLMSGYFEKAAGSKTPFTLAGGREEWFTKPLKEGELLEIVQMLERIKQEKQK